MISPYAKLEDVEPWMQTEWSAHWMAVTARVEGEMVYLINAYAPHKPELREHFYKTVATVRPPTGARVLMGGNVNCTQDATVDRTYRSDKDDHFSPAFASLERTWGLQDTIAHEATAVANLADLVEFSADYHTYFYKMASGRVCSSRFDRWHVSAHLAGWVRNTVVIIPGPPSDHNGVLLQISNPKRRRSKKIQALAYSLPGYARD